MVFLNRKVNKPVRREAPSAPLKGELAARTG